MSEKRLSCYWVGCINWKFKFYRIASILFFYDNLYEENSYEPLIEYINHLFLCFIANLHLVNGRSAWLCIYFPPYDRYDAEATYFEEGVRSSKRKQLEEKLLQVNNS